MLYRNQIVDPRFLTMDKGLVGMLPLEIYKEVVETLTSKNIMVILDNQISNAGWCCDVTDFNGLWFNDFNPVERGYTEEQFFQSWELLADLFSTNSFVIGYDIRNEIRPVLLNSTSIMLPFWGESHRKMLETVKQIVDINKFTVQLLDWQEAAQTFFYLKIGLQIEYLLLILIS
jgi:hypothetical protein